MNIQLVQTSFEKRCQSKIARCEANIRRFDNSRRDTPKRNYWWRQRRKWELKLKPWPKQQYRFIDFPSPSYPGFKDTLDTLSYLHGSFKVEKHILTAFDPADGPDLKPLQLVVDAERYQKLVENVDLAQASNEVHLFPRTGVSPDEAR